MLGDVRAPLEPGGQESQQRRREGQAQADHGSGLRGFRKLGLGWSVWDVRATCKHSGRGCVGEDPTTRGRSRNRLAVPLAPLSCYIMHIRTAYVGIHLPWALLEPQQLRQTASPARIPSKHRQEPASRLRCRRCLVATPRALPTSPTLSRFHLLHKQVINFMYI